MLFSRLDRMSTTFNYCPPFLHFFYQAAHQVSSSFIRAKAKNAFHIRTYKYSSKAGGGRAACMQSVLAGVTQAMQGKARYVAPDPVHADEKTASSHES